MKSWLDLRAGLLVAPPALLVLGLSTALSFSLISARARPEVAMAAWPWSAEAHAQLASKLLESNAGPRVAPAAERLASAALRRDPTNVAAARTLSATRALAGKSAESSRLLAYAESLSRRDFLTELALIEGAVARNDIPEALVHYDHALRTSPRSYDLMFPILIKASDDPQIREPLGLVLSGRPPWWSAFMDRFLAESGSPQAILAFVRRVGLRADNEGELGMLRVALDRLVALRAYKTAYLIYSYARPGRGSPLIRDGGFAQVPLLAPFDWSLVDEADLRAHIEAQSRGKRALFLYAANGRAGIAARQLLVLQPGEYELTLKAGQVPAAPVGRPRVIVTCDASAAPRELLNEPLAYSSSAFAQMRLRFTVPPQNCDAQLISFRVSASDVAIESWVRDLALYRL